MCPSHRASNWQNHNLYPDRSGFNGKAFNGFNGKALAFPTAALLTLFLGILKCVFLDAIV